MHFDNNYSKPPSTFKKNKKNRKGYLINSSISFNSNNIGHDMISTRMLKICGESISKPSEIIFKSYIEKGPFSSEWKKANVFPVHKKGW